ncbi:Similar to Vegetative incompatibility protein HET-E-1; acc. no. Q00808 [Pyronema omphalodes CBS 100304]|uniref:Similar to Vegetative incompatibility protein HET-E-1 acc. no. Q00808 n=1 Tax=Pyronema omphalodes (strain CBS 100304) TaxID=1076935 RepID=U4L721_PYROM|nr:Similar to Vegetative incompatibility protein HET-E-1; acc. no. Q00808 [Pyronema omphalodes CBS 100304]
MRKSFEAIIILKPYRLLLTGCREDNVIAFTDNSIRFVNKFREILAIAPLQIYSSAILFSPINSIVRNLSWGQIPRWVDKAPEVLDTWSPLLSTIRGGTVVKSIAFSPDSTLLASRTPDAIQLWGPRTGESCGNFEGDFKKGPHWTGTVVFSPDGNLIAANGYPADPDSKFSAL